MEWRSISNFSARLAIPGVDVEDTSLNAKRREKSHAMRRRLRRMDRATSKVMDSGFYKVARVAVLLVLGGSAGGLYLYLKNNKWMLKTPPVRAEVTAPALPRHTAGGGVRPNPVTPSETAAPPSK